MTKQELKECIAEVKYSAIPKPSKKRIIDVLYEKWEECETAKTEVIPLQAVTISDDTNLHKNMCVKALKNAICDKVMEYIEVSFSTKQNEPKKVYVDARLDIVRRKEMGSNGEIDESEGLPR